MINQRLCGLGRRLAACLAVAAAAGGGALADEAADYPQRPVKIVVGYSPGGATDVIARLVATELSSELGQSFIVENKPGAGGNIATENVIRSKPDGYTLLVLTIQNATNMSVYKNIGYDTNKDLQPIAQFMASPSVLVASPKLQIDSLQALIKTAKADPTALSYASTGVGGSPHLAGEMLKSRAGIDMLHVPYKGTAPAMTDVIAGNVSVSFMTTLGVLEQMQSGKMRPLAVAYGSRLAELPNVPTMAEAGLPDFEVTSWNGLAAPAGTPPAIVEKLSAAVNRILQKPAIQERVRGLGGQAVLRNPQEFAAYVQAETDKWAQVVKAANISMD
ncbi:tripartite tricarboxylate transporter substrate binding protein [Bordetella sp. BOR01]|uniref:Bug family tripartite tricarboxylate transporter substrate binding protein n=1 Tax=Bordetella sp. BOR01 TaxID=2854779 RepID=UPI001C45284E|nr:tripartite tricarboxylate transporter substrate binding protein [Bordetella sp. BOR01]MBV7483117.1 tripartite tricarboxylate transporter substrate binding protein [Bordetella sp. BOR01]